jgi:hypothetical protein
MKAPTKKSSEKPATEAESTALKLLDGIMQEQEKETSPELKAKRARLLQMITTSSLLPVDSTGSTPNDATSSQAQSPEAKIQTKPDSEMVAKHRKALR